MGDGDQSVVEYWVTLIEYVGEYRPRLPGVRSPAFGMMDWWLNPAITGIPPKGPRAAWGTSMIGSGDGGPAYGQTTDPLAYQEWSTPWPQRRSRLLGQQTLRPGSSTRNGR